MTTALEHLAEEARACTLCAAHLPLGPRPVFRVSGTARLLIIGQAPGTKVHASGITFNDASGERLRGWMGIGREQFYDADCDHADGVLLSRAVCAGRRPAAARGMRAHVA
jgi:uracil-DNA glycosylase